jgi:hypothetical protein
MSLISYIKLNQTCMQAVYPITEPTLQRVLRALQDPLGLEVYSIAADPHHDMRRLQTARQQLLWKLQRNGGRCEHVDSKGVACAQTVWDYMRLQVPWMQFEWHHINGEPAVYIGRYRTPRTHTHTHPRAQRSLQRVETELQVCRLLCRDHHAVHHLQNRKKQRQTQSWWCVCVCVCVCVKKRDRER